MTLEAAAEPYFAEIDPHIPAEPDPDFLGPAVLESWSRSLEIGIRQSPERYQFVIDLLGERATSGRADELMRLGIIEEDLEAATVIMAYFLGNCDRGVVFDDDTEKALISDPILREARDTHRNTTSKTYAKGVMSHELRPHQDAIPAKNAMRRLTIECYIARVIAWKQQHQD